MRRSIWTAVPLLAVLAVAAGTSARAAEDAVAPGAAPTELVRLQVRPGKEAAMERFLARLAEGARRTGAPVRWRAHRRIDGERPLYVLVLRAASPEQLDAWGSLTPSAMLERAYGPDEAQRVLALREESLEGLERERFVLDPSLGFED